MTSSVIVKPYTKKEGVTIGRLLTGREKREGDGIGERGVPIVGDLPLTSRLLRRFRPDVRGDGVRDGTLILSLDCMKLGLFSLNC